VAVLALYWKTSGHTATFPSPFSSYINAYLVLKGEPEEPIRDLQYDGSISTPLQKIVLIVDESIRGDFLSLNNPSTDTTPFLVSQRSRIDNFGIAVAGANCSQESRVALRYGLQERDLKKNTRMIAEGPTFWQFAKRAGFETVYIDAYGSATHLTHGMRAQELAFVDRHIIVNDMPQYRRDERVATILGELLSEPRRMFIFVEKFGAHTPYNAGYPPTKNVFQAPRDRVFDLEDRTNLRAQYRNSIRWAVDGFFSKLMANSLPQESLLIYTSDHGQSLSENTTLQSHCSQGARAVAGEANVPLFAISTDARWRSLLSQGAAENHDRVSSLDIFPTLVEAMGYAPEWVRAHSEYSLIAPIPRDRRRIFWASGSAREYDAAP
jgi:glucan phosphoethanolaminetransferase (alkaline phosphatase superfamily)